MLMISHNPHLVLVYQLETVDHIATVMVDVVLTRTLYFKILRLNQFHFFLKKVVSLIAHLYLYYILFITKQEKLAINII